MTRVSSPCLCSCHQSCVHVTWELPMGHPRLNMAQCIRTAGKTALEKIAGLAEPVYPLSCNCFLPMTQCNQRRKPPSATRLQSQYLCRLDKTNETVSTRPDTSAGMQHGVMLMRGAQDVGVLGGSVPITVALVLL